MSLDATNSQPVAKISGDEAAVARPGNLESNSPFALEALLDAAIGRQRAAVERDVSELDDNLGAGTDDADSVETRLAALGVRLTGRPPSDLINRLLGFMETTEMSPQERGLPEHVHLGPEQKGAIPAVQGLGPNLSSADLRRVTAIPADTDVVDGALQLVVELARSCVSGADGVSVSLLRHGRLSTVAASDQTILDMDADQYATGEGPCVDASMKGRWFHAESLATETRWPSFIPQARDLGINAILSSPLNAFDQPVGALNIYSRTASTFDVKAQETAAVFAQKASVILSDARAGVSDSQMGFRFQEALRSREIISLAMGVIMEREGMDEEQAFAALLRLSLYSGVALRRRAEEMVLSARRPQLGPEGGSNVIA
jgi:ANTAR domain/GAF domain